MNARIKELAEEALALTEQIEKTQNSLFLTWKEWVLAKEREHMAVIASRLSQDVRALSNEKARDAQVAMMTTKERVAIHAASFAHETMRVTYEAQERRLKALLEMVPVLARGE